MFEIPDDDEHLFDDIPLDDITNKQTTVCVAASTRPQLRVPETTTPTCIGNTTAQLCSGDKRGSREFNPSPPHHFNRPEANRISPELGEDQVVTPIITTQNIVSASRTSRLAADSSNTDHVTPKRKRKFPGPAGLLPKLGSGKGIDIQSLCAAERTPQPSTPVQEGREPGLPLSQSSDDVFSDVPWQTMLIDLGEDGIKLMKKFSIGSTLLKAGKKQLYQGKAILLFGVVEFIESHGSEASVTLRDKSGKMQGTIHKDLLKEYEVELQIGTVLVLKQVSIISLSNRNHYLNITPNNLVCMYHSKNNKLTTLKFHGSQESLRSVLIALEKKAASRKSMDTSLTTGSVTGSSRQSLSGSSTGTPILPGSLPSTPVLNQQLLGRPGTPYSAHTSSRLTTPAGVRDVGVVTPSSAPVTPSLFGNSDNFNNTTPGNSRLSSLLQNRNISTGAQNVQSNTSSAFSNRVNQSSSGQTVGANSNSNVNSNKSGNCDLMNSDKKEQSWRFKQPSSTPRPDINMNQKTSTNTAYGTPKTYKSQFQLNSPNAAAIPSSPAVIESNKPKWSFKSPSSLSNSSSSGSPASAQSSVNTANNRDSLQHKSSAVPAPPNTEDMWDDDLNDELLSQLSDEMT